MARRFSHRPGSGGREPELVSHDEWMNQRLGPVLSTSDLPEAELCAARLDGELFGLLDCFSPIDIPEHAATRASALATLLPPRLIAEQRTAAWVFGINNAPPSRHQACSPSGQRSRLIDLRGVDVREVVIDESELVMIGPLRLTSPLRTALDITRLSHRFAREDQHTVRGLLALARSDENECIRAVQARRNLPGKRRTVERLRLLEQRTEREGLIESVRAA